MINISKEEGKALNAKCPEHITKTVHKYLIDETTEARQMLKELRDMKETGRK